MGKEEKGSQEPRQLRGITKTKDCLSLFVCVCVCVRLEIDHHSAEEDLRCCICYLGKTNDLDDNVGAKLGTDLNVFVVVVGGQEGFVEESHCVCVMKMIKMRRKRVFFVGLVRVSCPVERWVPRKNVFRQRALL